MIGSKVHYRLEFERAQHGSFHKTFSSLCIWKWKKQKLHWSHWSLSYTDSEQIGSISSAVSGLTVALTFIFDVQDSKRAGWHHTGPSAKLQVGFTVTPSGVISPFDSSVYIIQQYCAQIQVLIMLVNDFSEAVWFGDKHNKKIICFQDICYIWHLCASFSCCSVYCGFMLWHAETSFQLLNVDTLLLSFCTLTK